MSDAQQDAPSTTRSAVITPRNIYPDVAVPVLTQNPYKKKRVATNQEEAEEDWIKFGYPNKFEWAFAVGKLSGADYEPDADVHQSVPTPSNRNDDADENPQPNSAEESCGTYDSYATPVPNKTVINTDNSTILVTAVSPEVTEDPTKWDSIPLYDDSAGFGSVANGQSDTQDDVVLREERRVKAVTDLANRLYRYHKACLALIRAKSPKWQPLLYIRQELFAEKMANLAFQLMKSSMPAHLMSASAIKTHFCLENDDMADFVERMSLYDMSRVVFDYADRTHDAKSVMVVHQSSTTDVTLKVCYKWRGRPPCYNTTDYGQF